MSIAPALLAQYPKLNEAQRSIVGHCDGPLLVIAGPGSGKTLSLVLRAMNLLLLGKAKPKSLVLCTFTEKAAFEMRDRISAAAHKVNYKADLSELQVSTIHSFCNRLLTTHRHRTVLGSNYETLDDLTQLLFLFEQFKEILGAESPQPYLAKWNTKWTAIEGMRDYFNKITEELVDPQRLCESANPFLQQLGRAYVEYRRLLLANNRLDFAHQQKLVFDLLADDEVSNSITRGISHLMVDEYQDTNFIQERILFKLTETSRNICVVGDEDQSLYRFRGATVRNILEFRDRVPGCAAIQLVTNYRSHERIVKAYDHWMASTNWSNPSGLPFRFPKMIRPDPKANHPIYPAVFSIWGRDARDEAECFAEMVAFLKANNVIADFSQVALLLHSVRQDHSGRFIDALERKGIPAFCPRARAYFDNDEVRLMVACLALIFGYHGVGRGQLSGSLVDLAKYVDGCIVDLGKKFGGKHPLGLALRRFVADIQALQEG